MQKSCLNQIERGDGKGVFKGGEETGDGEWNKNENWGRGEWWRQQPKDRGREKRSFFAPPLLQPCSYSRSDFSVSRREGGGKKRRDFPKAGKRG